jgi:hypothetical protein
MARDLADSFGVKPSLLRSPDEIEARRMAQAKIAQEQAGLEQITAGAEAVRNLSQAAQAGGQAA